jgi:Flp pilus assembly protein TadG
LKHRSRGQSAVYTILFLPILVLILAMVADIGTLQMQKVRLRSALDMAAVDAVQELDADHYARTGTIRLDAVRADAATRQFLLYNLDPLAPQLGGRAVVDRIAREAEVAVINEVPSRNPFTGVTLERPAVAARMRVPVRTGLLHLIGIGNVITLTIAVDAEVKG